MTFNNHIKTICKKAGQALCALLKISNYIDQFCYCPLVWMFSSGQSNNLIEKITRKRFKNNKCHSSIRIKNTINQRNCKCL